MNGTCHLGQYLSASSSPRTRTMRSLAWLRRCSNRRAHDSMILLHSHDSSWALFLAIAQVKTRLSIRGAENEIYSWHLPSLPCMPRHGTVWTTQARSSTSSRACPSTGIVQDSLASLRVIKFAMCLRQFSGHSASSSWSPHACPSVEAWTGLVGDGMEAMPLCKLKADCLECLPHSHSTRFADQRNLVDCESLVSHVYTSTLRVSESGSCRIDLHDYAQSWVIPCSKVILHLLQALLERLST